MTIMDIMARSGSSEPNLVIKYVKQAIEEIQSRQKDNVDEDTISVVANQREYDLSSYSIVRLLSVWQKDDNGLYVPCKQAVNWSNEEA